MKKILALLSVLVVMVGCTHHIKVILDTGVEENPHPIVFHRDPPLEDEEITWQIYASKDHHNESDLVITACNKCHESDGAPSILRAKYDRDGFYNLEMDLTE